MKEKAMAENKLTMNQQCGLQAKKASRLGYVRT